jgi:flagellin
MSSILTNSSAITALQNLNNTQKNLNKTQSQISTGLKVATAADNATNWSVSTQMKSDNSVVGTIRDGLKQNSTLLKTAVGALDQIKDTIIAMQEQVAQAADVDSNDGAEGYTEVNKSLEGLASTLKGLIEGANFNGVNLLATDTAALEFNVVTGKKADSTFSTVTFTAENLTTELTDLMPASFALAGGASTTIADLSADLDAGLETVRNLAAHFGAVQNQIDAQSKFLETLSGSLTNGISAMVDADMNEASTRLQALQTQQQLGVQSLSIANQNSQMILKLFQ